LVFGARNLLTYDVIIIGAGPAGTTLARELAKTGVKTLILEKERLPRYKPCAGGVSLRAAKLLDFDISSAVERVVYGGEFSYNLSVKCERHSEKPIVYLTSRDRFDVLLAEEAAHAGADLVDGARVAGIARVAEGFRVETPDGEYLSRVLAGADGANGVTAPALNLTSGFTNGVAIACEVYPGDRNPLETGDKFGLDLGTIPAGYGWSFPKSDHFSIGAAGSLTHANKLGHYIDRLIQFYCPGGNVRMRKGAMLHMRNNRRTPITYGGALLVGEAAGLVNAFTGEGIYYAIKSGKLAAPELLRYLKNDVSDFDGYTTAVNRELMPELGLSRTIAKIAFASSLSTSRLFFDTFAANKTLWRLLSGVLSGEKTYAEFRIKHKALRPLLALMGG
jgi:geranylgeranyl reductase family protein